MPLDAHSVGPGGIVHESLERQGDLWDLWEEKGKELSQLWEDLPGYQDRGFFIRL